MWSSVDSWQCCFAHHYSGSWRKFSDWLPLDWIKFSLTGEPHPSHTSFLFPLWFLTSHLSLQQSSTKLPPSISCHLSLSSGYKLLLPCFFLSAVYTALHQQQLVWQIWWSSPCSDRHHDLVPYRLLVCCRGTLWCCLCQTHLRQAGEVSKRELMQRVVFWTVLMRHEDVCAPSSEKRQWSSTASFPWLQQGSCWQAKWPTPLKWSLWQGSCTASHRVRKQDINCINMQQCRVCLNLPVWNGPVLMFCSLFRIIPCH